MATPGVPNFDAPEKNLSPEQNMSKQKENSRTGGVGGGRKRAYSYEEAPLSPMPEAPYAPIAREPEVPQGITLELTPDANDKDMEELLASSRLKVSMLLLKN